MNSVLIAELAALVAALCWAIGGLISAGPARQLGGYAFNRIRMLFVFAMLLVVVAVSGGWRTLSVDQLGVLALSGLIGVLLGDTLLFSALGRLGPRLNALIFSTSAPISALLGFLLLDERLGPWTLFGCLLVSAGVALAIVFGRRVRANAHLLDTLQGPLATGVLLAFSAAACQAIGALIAKPVMESGVDPFAAATIRVGVAALVMAATFPIKRLRHPAHVVIDRRLIATIIVSGTLGMLIGMTLILWALSIGKTGVILTLSSTTPVLMLPLLWFATRQRPSAGAWFGATTVLVGSALIFLY
ncbi:DMT family transporter [Gammaproteobacteria bacterium]|nr:DMT family transporter [Gammaproteobacteria bacterium]